HSQPFDFTAGAVEEHDAGWAEEAELLEQRLVLGRVGGDIRAQHEEICQTLPYLRIGEREALHFLAGGTPFGRELESDRRPRARQSAFQFGIAFHRLETPGW